ncbi:MAG TPA: hypothetical protein VNN74_04070 [Candidatus Micrarchaeia archaeon]|nr:hypothetical protein [Candidatus Micrarchaeia archaeon]
MSPRRPAASKETPGPGPDRVRSRERGGLVIGVVLVALALLNLTQVHPDVVGMAIEGLIGLSLVAGAALALRRGRAHR